MPELTVVIPIANEGWELTRTVKEIRQTAENEVDVMLVDDHSEDNYDYAGVAARYGCSYIRNPFRVGAGGSRNIGMSRVKTPYALLVDSHMFFSGNDWWRRIAEELRLDDRAVYCTKGMTHSCEDFVASGEYRPTGATFGAYIRLMGDRYLEILEPRWIAGSKIPRETVVDIPCVLGATYGVSTRYWQAIGGLDGLKAYGGEELHLSLKTWMEGGRCRLITDVQIGHLYRQRHTYPTSWDSYFHNKILTIRTLLGEDTEYEQALRHDPLYGEGLKLLDNNEVACLRERYSHFPFGMERFLEINHRYAT